MSARGQNLVLLALSMLLLTFLVLMTLSIGMKAKARMELQTVADATAYSNSVATARTMNSIAVMNRVQVAHTVSTLGTLSLISWATLYWKHAEQARDLYLAQAAIFALGVLFYCLPPPARPQCPFCRRGVAKTLAAAGLTALEANSARRKIRRDTDLFTNETLPRWNASLALFGNQAQMRASLMNKLNSPPASFGNQLATMGNLPYVQALGAASGINQAEIDGMMVPLGPGGLSGDQPYHAAQLVMGSRGHPFIPDRNSSGSWTWDLTVPWALPAGITWVDRSDTGRGYLNQGWTSNPNGPPYAHPYGHYAHDWGDTTRTIIILTPWTRCGIFGLGAMAYGVIGTDMGRKVRLSDWEHPGIHNGVQHAFQTFPPFIDYEQTNLTDTDNLYGQPKNLSVMSSDPRAHRDPWDMKLNFQFTPGGADFDMIDRPAALNNGLTLAIGSGVTYYSRPDHYAEPPNLFAPYWRSTLSRMTVDRPAAGPLRAAYDLDLINMLNATGQTEAAVTFRSLATDDYKGFE